MVSIRQIGCRLPASLLTLGALSASAYADPDMGTTDSAGLVLAVLGLVVLLLGLHHLRDLRTKTLMPPGYRHRPLKRAPARDRDKD